MCVILYLTVLVFEAMPIIANLEWLRKRFPKIAAMMERVHHYAPIPGDHRTGAFQPAPIFTWRNLWRDQSATVLVQA